MAPRLPRGVTWPQHELYLASNASGDAAAFDPDSVRARLYGPGPVGLPAAPLMRGTGFVFAATFLNRDTVLTLPYLSFDAARLLATMDRERVTDLCIVGDVFCRPMVEALEREPGRWDLSSLKVVSSSGMMWSPAVKRSCWSTRPAIGLVNRVVAPGAVMDTAATSPAASASVPPIALAKTKEAMVRSNGRPMQEAFAIEAQCITDNAKTAVPRKGRARSWRSGLRGSLGSRRGPWPQCLAQNARAFPTGAERPFGREHRKRKDVCQMTGKVTSGRTGAPRSWLGGHN